MFQEAIDDCTRGEWVSLCGCEVVTFSLSSAPVLELEPRYFKAIMRRAQALEALEKYEDALEGEYVETAWECGHGKV